MTIRQYALPLTGCFFLLLTAGCAYIPIASMWSLSRLSPETLATLDPAGIRARVTLPQAIALKPEGNVISLALTREDEVVNKFELPLQILREEATPTGWFDSDDNPRRDFILSVTPDGQKDLRKLQSHWQAHSTDHDGGSVNVVMKLDRSNITGPTEFLTSVAVRLKKDGDFILLFEDLPLILDVEPTETHLMP